MTTRRTQCYLYMDALFVILIHLGFELKILSPLGTADVYFKSHIVHVASDHVLVHYETFVSQSYFILDQASALHVSWYMRTLTQESLCSIMQWTHMVMVLISALPLLSYASMSAKKSFTCHFSFFSCLSQCCLAKHLHLFSAKQVFLNFLLTILYNWLIWRVLKLAFFSKKYFPCI